MRLRPAVPLALLLPLAAALVVTRSASSAQPAIDPASTAVVVADAAPRPISVRPGAAATLPVARERPARRHQIALVRGAVGLRSRPGGAVDTRVGDRTEFGSQRVLGVAARRGRWLGLVTTERPNGKLAWVDRDHRALRLRRVGWSLHADLSGRFVELRRAGRPVKRVTVAIGRPGSTTPTGRFAITDKIPGSRFGPYYGCCILALSGHQPNTPPGWQGGDRLAIHGTDAPATIGAAASAGCLRAADAGLRFLMRRVPLGTPVFIRR